MSLHDIPLLILAGGKATRLKHLSQKRAKYLQPITEYAVFADLHLRWVAQHGFRKVVLSVGHLGEQIQSHCGDGSRYGLEISYLDDGAEPIGTGGAVRGALKFPFEILAVTYGDTILKVDVPKFLNEFSDSTLLAGMTLYKNAVPGHVCNADILGSIAKYDKKNPEPQWSYIDYGFLALRRAAIERFPVETPLDLADPLSLFSHGSQLFGFPVADRFWEIGSPEALAELQRAFAGDFDTYLKL
jgi:MurNAc alpha-1-phosphate uridylyltransferase